MQSSKSSQSSMTRQMMSASQAACGLFFVYESVCCVRVEVTGVTSQCVKLWEINHMFIGVCVVSSYGSLGLNANNVKWATRSAPQSVFCLPRDSPSPVLLFWQRVEKSTPFKQEFGAMWSISVFVWVAGREWGVFILLEHDPVSQEKKMRTRIDGRNKEDKKRKTTEGQMEMECTSRIWICRADIAVFRPILQKVMVEKNKTKPKCLIKRL